MSVVSESQYTKLYHIGLLYRGLFRRLCFYANARVSEDSSFLDSAFRVTTDSRGFAYIDQVLNEWAQETVEFRVKSSELESFRRIVKSEGLTLTTTLRKLRKAKVRVHGHYERINRVKKKSGLSGKIVY